MSPIHRARCRCYEETNYQYDDPSIQKQVLSFDSSSPHSKVVPFLHQPNSATYHHSWSSHLPSFAREIAFDYQLHGLNDELSWTAEAKSIHVVATPTSKCECGIQQQQQHTGLFIYRTLRSIA